MQRRVLRLTMFGAPPSPARSNSLSRSPLSPISAPKMQSKKSIRQLALGRTYKIGHTDPVQPLVPSHPSSRRRPARIGCSRYRPEARTLMMEESFFFNADSRKSFKWVKGEAIGRGTRGRVYQGLNASTGEMLAIKQVAFSSTTRSSGRPSPQTLKREMENMKNLQHANLIQYLGLEDEDDTVFIFMEYVPGCSLHDSVLKHGAFGDAVVKSFIAQILEGLAFLHARRVMHGDLKSTNILVNPDGVCKIAGLGCSETAPRDNSQEVPRAIFWTAPEVIKTQYKSYTAMADIWSLGCIMLEMCSGMRPWARLEAVAVMFKLYHQTSRPELPADLELHSGAKDFMEMCLALDPNERAPALELRQHPYLVPSPGWSFDGF